jgi:glycosyltransferase involved in cell wall biosynthesis
MHISLSMPYSTFSQRGGYWYAAKNITQSLENLGAKVTFNDASADIMFNFCQPQDYVSNEGQFTIGYTPWESTGMDGPHNAQHPPADLVGMGIGYQDEGKPLETWIQMINSLTDEFWTTNSLGLEWFLEGGVDKPTKVFPHGIEPIWHPLERIPHGPITFLHVGEPAERKCGEMVFRAFKELFGNNPDYKLIIKGHGWSSVRDFDPAGMIRRPDELIHNVEVDIRDVETPELVSIFHRATCLVYPSWGEGFGFIPLQAMASGMPVIMNESWADYRDLAVGLRIEDRRVASPWQGIHPGDMMEPDFESLKEQMLLFASNTERYTKEAYSNAAAVHKAYNWDNTVAAAFSNFM